MATTAQADAGGEGYVTDVPYLRNFVEDLAPTRMRLCAALNGFTPPPAQGFDYCEIGSGNGDTLATLAAACPTGRFLGIDINLEHVTFANGLASRGGLRNVSFVEHDFEELRHDTLPGFDFMGTHGVMSWISAEKRRALIAFVAAKLKPGGLFHASYNALPGWAAIEPLRRLLLDSAAGVTGGTLDKARHAVAVANLLNDGGAEYFSANPSARAMLQTMRQAGLSYVAHEYFHTHWSPMYFADVAREMAAAGLYFIGQLPAYLNYRDLALPPELRQALGGIDNRGAFESYKDFALNEFFRRDVYVKGQAPCSPAATRAYLESTTFGAPAGRILREVRLPHYTLQYVGAIFDALVPALTESPATVAELAARPELATFGATAIGDALLRLLLGEQIVPLARAAKPTIRTGCEGPYRVPLAYNRMVLGQKLASKNLVVLASPLSETGLVLSMVQAVALHLVTEVAPTDREAWLQRFVAERTLKLHDGDRLVTDRAEQQRVLSQQVDELSARRLPELLALGILEEA
jgi:hypothetical protein